MCVGYEVLLHAYLPCIVFSHVCGASLYSFLPAIQGANQHKDDT